MAPIHPLACVDPAAAIADDAEVGPYCIVGPEVTLATGCRLIAHVHVAGRTSIGERTVVHPFAALGGPPQSVVYRGEPTALVIGSDCIIREGVTMSLGTAQGGGVTSVGDNCFVMANAHVGHDSRVGNHVTFANGATLGGHCQIGDHAFLGGLCAIHQFGRVGEHALISGVAGVRDDVIPYGLALGSIARLGGLNVVGMRRRGMSKNDIAKVRAAFHELFADEGVFADRVKTVAERYGDHQAVAAIIRFIRADARRPLCRPGGHGQI